ncbi:hypothetical protein MYW52_22680 [Pseudomonas juntendi]|uniref:hypothetical protein n=1 Tax=Pseudomonas juntendi TaxID=2666183 RepID=UPI001FFD5DCA|nr:hypothetical protein [Pseudomonas juntendi]MCK2118289.1 hypothetical protein [Pseudomonas juntendi]
MDIAAIFKTHNRIFGEDRTIKMVTKVDESFLARQANGIVGQGHDPREKMRTSNTRLISKIAALAKCSARVMTSKTGNPSTFFPAGFVDKLAGVMISNLRKRSSELEDSEKDLILAHS